MDSLKTSKPGNLIYVFNTHYSALGIIIKRNKFKISIIWQFSSESIILGRYEYTINNFYRRLNVDNAKFEIWD